MKLRWKAIVLSCVALVFAGVVIWYFVHAELVARQLVKDATACRMRAEQGDAESQFRLGSMYYHGQGVSRNYHEALDWYSKAAAQGNIQAEYAIGQLYYHAYGVSQDYVEAVHWYRRAADHGYARAQASLGGVYYRGNGVPKDYVEAVRWFRKAAEQGDARGQYDLGFMYEHGYGVSQDRGEANRLFRQAAAQGNEAASRAIDLNETHGPAANKTALSLMFFVGLLFLLLLYLQRLHLRRRRPDILSNTRKGSFHLVRLAGIDVFLHWSWFVAAAYEVSARGRHYPSVAWNIAEYLALFLIVTFHEFGHALACRQVGGTANKVVLWPLGGVAYVEPPLRPAATLWSIAAGPLVNVVLGAGAYGLLLWIRHAGWSAVVPHAYRLLWAVCFMNLGLLIFNLLPIYPLDGGQILRSLLWFVLGRARSLTVTAVLGLVGAVGLIAVAVLLHSFWIGLISLYMVMNCWAGIQQAQILSRLESPPPALCGRLGEEYTEITDPRTQSRVRARHSSNIASLQALGFQHFAFRVETLPPYSAILKFPIVLMLLSKEVLVFPKPARLGVANILLIHSSPSSIAEVTGLGISFHSVFIDGTLLISSNYHSPLSPGTNCRIIKNPGPQTVEEAWVAHTQKAGELGAQGLILRSLSSFADYVEIEKMKLGMVIDT